MRNIRPLAILLIFAFGLAVLLPWQAALANTYQVTNTNDSGAGSLRQAIINANTHPGTDTITFAAATNGVPIILAGAAGDDANASGDLDILDGGDLTIQGNGAANTILDGGGIDRVFHVCPGGGCTYTITISGVTIRNGKPGLFDTGGGIYNNGAMLNIQNSKIGGAGHGNQAWVGGGIYNEDGSTTTVDSTTISANAALGGGGIYNKATLTVQNGSFIGKAGESNQATDGGGLYNYSGTLTVDGSAVSGNLASDHGGGIFNIAVLNLQNGSTVGSNKASQTGGGIYNDDTGVVTVESSTITNNTATNGYGGGIATNGIGKITVDGSTVSSNSAGISGGGIFNSQVLIVRNGSTVGGAGAANSAAEKGGGIYNTANATVSGSTVSANKAESGGGIYNTTSLYIQNGSTVGGAGAGNNATYGGGIYNTGSTRVARSTVNANEANRGGGIYNTGTLDLQSGSIIGEAGAGNQATEYGGGIYNDGGTATLFGSRISANQSEYGGGIYSLGWLYIQNGSTVGESGASNHASSGGGVLNAGIMNLSDSAISANTAETSGGGIYNYGTLNITASTIGGVGGGNQITGASGNGGGIYNADRGAVTLDSSTVSANTSTRFGGGIYNEETLNLQNGSLIGETGMQNYALQGGGIYNSFGTTTVDDSTVSANDAYTWGGGIFNLAILKVQNGSTIGGLRGGNTAGNDGGGIYNDNAGTTTVDGSTVSANRVNNYGGGIYNGGTLIVQNGSLIGEAGMPNSAEIGGGIQNGAGTTTVDSSTIGVNSAENGGGIYNQATLVVQNGSTIGGFESGNEATEYGGGIYNHSGSMTVTGSRILYNTATNDGGGVYNDVNAIGAAKVMSSCIIGNSAASFCNNQLAKQIATGNWWRAATGPNTPGADTTSGTVDVSGFLTAPPPSCALKLYLPLTMR